MTYNALNNSQGDIFELNSSFLKDRIKFKRLAWIKIKENKKYISFT